MTSCILNGAVGGTRIDEQMPEHAEHGGQAKRDHAIYSEIKKRVIIRSGCNCHFKTGALREERPRRADVLRGAAGAPRTESVMGETEL